MSKILPLEYETVISKYLTKKLESENLKEKYLNELIKEDVLELLDEFCTVVYYPLPDDQNHGFHITNIPFANGEKQPFVFINTAQTVEKQVFTAAHELGHLWGVDEYVCKTLSEEDCSSEHREDIINRFAATLLMPQEIFIKSAEEAMKSFVYNDNEIDFADILKLIAILMNRFFAPMKAVVKRMWELNFIGEIDAIQLLGEGRIPKSDINILMQQIFSEYGYIKFQKPTEKKWIEGLAEKLDMAEKQGLISQTKIDNMRTLFDLKKTTVIERNDVFTLSSSRGVTDDAT